MKPKSARRRRRAWWMAIAIAGMLGCCTSGSGGGEDGSNGSQDGITDARDGATVNETADPGPDDPWHSDECRQVTCQGHLYQCGDCIDNDDDDQIDFRDLQCLGPCDNNEDGFNTNIPGGASAPCKLDCYFDQDSGEGNDDCHWDLRCDPLKPQGLNTCNHDLACGNCDCDGWYAAQSQLCLDFCLPLVPNGCDCFGCCQLEPVANPGAYRFIGSPGCTIDNIESCDPCTPNPSCINECDHCEICVGKPELPADCTTGEDQCPPGVQPCGQPGQDPCPENYYCITGCCIETVM